MCIPGCHPLDELQPAAWQANPAKAINYFEQFAHQLHSARRPTLFSFLRASGRAKAPPKLASYSIPVSIFFFLSSSYILSRTLLLVPIFRHTIQKVSWCWLASFIAHEPTARKQHKTGRFYQQLHVYSCMCIFIYSYNNVNVFVGGIE